MAKKSSKEKAKVVGQVADQVLQHLKADPVQFVDTVFNMELRAFQWQWWFLMEEHPDILGYACPRVGKTVVIQLRNLFEKLTTPHEEELIFAPKFDQAVKSFKVQYDIIERSELVQAFVTRNAAGKKEFGKSLVDFQNGSLARCFGATSQFEGENASIEHVDELDDIPNDALIRILGRAIGENKNGKPTRHRFTGVIWGKLNIWHYKTETDFFCLPPLDVYTALAAGYLDRKAVGVQRALMTDDEWLLTQCLIFFEARNYIWSSWLRMSQNIGLYWNLYPVKPRRRIKYLKRGTVAFGMDMGAQGSGEDASEYSLQVTEQVGNIRRWVWGKTWPPDIPADDLISEVADCWEFFQPDIGFGDARDANLIALINSELYSRRLTWFDWKMLGKNDMEGWREWAKQGLMTPAHNNGRMKHHMFASLKRAIFNCMHLGELQTDARVMVFPMVDREKSLSLPEWQELSMLIRELQNLVSEKTKQGYDKITRHKTREKSGDNEFGEALKLGDDRPDALAMSNWGLDFLEPRNRVMAPVKVVSMPGF